MAEGRPKPDIIALGAGILNTHSSKTAANWIEENPVGWWDRQNAATKAAFENPDCWVLPKPGPEGTNGTRRDMYSFASGTSFAAPQFAGCAALLREALLKGLKQYQQPSSALLKVLLINGAQDIAGGEWFISNGTPGNLGSIIDNGRFPIGRASNCFQGFGHSVLF